MGWALEGLALIVLWERLDHPGLKYFAVALFAAVTIRLVANDEVLAYHERGSWRILNWLLYTYLVPAAALFVAARRARAGRARPASIRRARAGTSERRPLGARVPRRSPVSSSSSSGSTSRSPTGSRPARRSTSASSVSPRATSRPRSPGALRALRCSRSASRMTRRALRWVSLAPAARDDRQGLPPRPRRARRSLSRRLAARPRGLAHPRLARVPALRAARAG